MKILTAFVLFVLLVDNAFALDQSCPAMQQEALANIVERCAEQEAGTLCLGGATVTPVYRQSAERPAALDAPGDAVSIAGIDWLSVSSEDRTWGVARALFPAYAGDGFEASDAALVALGNVVLFPQDAANPPAALVDVNVTAAQGANLRAAPNTDAPIIAQLTHSRDLKAVGRHPGGGWLLIYASPDLRGWISQTVVSAPQDVVPALDADAETAPLWLPWQRFDFRSGVDDAPCAAAPESGILLQSSKSDAPRRFVINGARLTLAGTAWLQAQISSGMLIHITDGRARISTAEGQAALSGGQFIRVTLERDDEGEIWATALTEAEAYNYLELSVLPIQALPYETRVSLDRYALIQPAPADGSSPLEALEPTSPCKFSAVLSGANMRSRPDPEAPIIAVMAHRESAEPIARGIGADSRPWWKLADRVWVRVDATVPGGNCNDLPFLRAES